LKNLKNRQVLIPGYALAYILGSYSFYPRC